VARSWGRGQGSCAEHEEVTNNMVQRTSNKSYNNSRHIKRYKNWDAHAHKLTYTQLQDLYTCSLGGAGLGKKYTETFLIIKCTLLIRKYHHLFLLYTE